MFSVLLGNLSKKQLRSLDFKMKERVAALLETLEQEPVPAAAYDVRKLADRNETYRIRLSGFRVVYQVEWAGRTVLVAKIERRSENTYS